ncbi:MAG TPA: trigger factor, partial [Gemmatimonadetes bacterium]|nr:trigger factor [Gemmatimonadota bacterium]
MVTKQDGLDLSIDQGENCKRTMRVKVPSHRVNSVRLAIAEKLGSKLKLPGFRKGHVPLHVVEQRFGDTLNREALDELVQATYTEALQETDLNPISEGQISDVNYIPGEELTFSASFDVKPEMEISRVGGFQIKRPTINVSESQIEEVVEHLRKQNGVWIPPSSEKPENGDLVSVKIENATDSENETTQPYEFILGNNQALSEIEEGIKSLTPGTSDRFEIEFPEEFPDEELRGKLQTLNITLDSHKTLEIPDLDDQFANSLGEFRDLKELKGKIETDLNKEAEERRDNLVRSRLLDSIIDANPFPVPESMVDRYVQSLLGDPNEISKEKLLEAMEEIGPQATLVVKRMLLV